MNKKHEPVPPAGQTNPALTYPPTNMAFLNPYEPLVSLRQSLIKPLFLGGLGWPVESWSMGSIGSKWPEVPSFLRWPWTSLSRRRLDFRMFGEPGSLYIHHVFFIYAHHTDFGSTLYLHVIKYVYYITVYVISSSSRHVFFFAAVGGIKASANTRKDWLNLDVISNLPCRMPTASGVVWHLCPDCGSRPTEYLDMECN